VDSSVLSSRPYNLCTAMRPALALACATLVAASPALAGKREALARAKVGQKLFAQGNFVGALAEFTEAQRESPLPWEYQYDIGLCEARLNHFAEALAAFEKFLREGGAVMAKSRFEAAMAERDKIRESTAEVSVRVEGGNAEILVDGEVVGRSPLPRPLVLKPGDHTFQAKAGENSSPEKAEKLVAGSQKVVALKLVDKSKEPAVLEITTAPEGAEVFVDGAPAGTSPTRHAAAPGLHVIVAELEGHKPAELEVRVAAGQKLPLELELEAIVIVEQKPLPIPGIIVAGAGVLCLVGSAALYANALYNRDQLNLIYRNGGTWDDQAIAHDATRKSSGAFSGIFGVLGGAAVAGGATLIVLNYFLKAPPKQKAKPKAVEEEAAPKKEDADEKAVDDKAVDDKPAADEKKPEPESSLMLVPVPGGAFATWTVTF
jgi:tetratricopeptide (TPR) repeat protein